MFKKPTYEELEKQIEILKKKLSVPEQKWRNILAHTPQIGVSLDPQARIVFTNNNFLKLTGWKKHEVIGQDWFDLFVPQDKKDEIRKVFLSTMVNKKSLEYTGFENKILTKSGELKDIAWSNFITKDIQKNVVEISCIGIDLTQRYQAEESLRLSNENFFTVLNSIDATVYVADMETYEILFANKNMVENFGRDVVGEVCYKVFRGETKPCSHCTNDKLVDHRGIPTGVTTWDGRNPITKKWFMNYDRAIRWTDKRVVRLQIATDITDLKDAYSKIKIMSVTDDLTQIFNRRHFHIRLNEEIQRVLRYKHPLSLLILDIDHFKKINDVYGHQVGDDVLVAIASILKSNLRKVDVVARYGGEEFVALLPETDKNSAYVTGEKLRKLIERYKFKGLKKRHIKVTACLGVTSLNLISSELPDMSHQIIKQADIALYEAKNSGRNSVILFSDD